MTFLTNLIFEPKGRHNASESYKIKDTVMSADGSRVYFALQDVPAGTELDNEDYWKLQIDLSASKNAMDAALAAFGSCAKAIGMRVKGETAKASGNPVSFLPDADSLLQPVTVLEPQQEGSGDPSPDNIRPFRGYNTLGLNCMGKNLFDFRKATPNQYGSFDENGRFTNTAAEAAGTGQYNYGFQEWSGRSSLIANNVIMWEAGRTKYTRTITVQPGTTTFCIRLYGERESAIWIENLEIPEGTKLTLSFDMLDDTPGKQVLDNIQIEIGGSASEYVPVHLTPYAVQISQTVYGGRFDWLTGKLVATHTGMDMGSMDWNYVSNSDYTCFNVNTAGLNVKPAKNVSTIADIRCSIFKPATWVNVYNRINNTICVMDSGSALIRAYTNAYTNAADFKAAMTGQTVVWELATPIEIGPFTPHIISAAGPEQTNTLYGDGSIEVEYVKPLHVSIEERVAAAVAAAMQN